MFLITFFIEKDIFVLSLYLIYLFLLFYSVGSIFSKYFNFERYNFFLKITIGFLLIFSSNFFFYSILSIFKLSEDIIITFEKIKQFFILFFLIFSFKNWININQKYNFYYFEKIIVTSISLIGIITIFYFSEKNLSWFNEYQGTNHSYDFYQFYFQDMNIQIDILEVTREIFLNYYLMFLFAILIYFSLKGTINQNSKNYLYMEILILALSIFFIYLLNLNSSTSEYYLVDYLFLYSVFLLYQKESYKAEDNIFNQLILLTIFLTFAATSWGIFYFIAFSISLILYSLYKDEDIYLMFSTFMLLLFIQLFFYIYNISIFYGFLFLGLSILVFYYPITSLFKWERSVELLEFEINLKKNQKKFVYIILTFILFLNLSFIFIDANLYFQNLKELLYFKVSNSTNEGLNLAVSITFFSLLVLTTFFFFLYLFFHKRKSNKEFSFYYFFSIIFLLFFNPFTIVTFSIIFDLSLNIGVYYFLFLTFNIFFILNFIKSFNHKWRV